MAIAQFSGLASGIDSAKLIDAIIDARSATNRLRQQEIDHLNSETDALEELNTKILSLNDLVDKFRTANGGGVKKKATSSDASVATASVGSTAVNGTYSITTSALASSATASFNDSYASTSATLAPNAVGTLAIEVDIGTGGNLKQVTVNITNTTTVQQFIDSFNADADASGNIVASAVNVGTTASPSYRVVFSGQHSGTSQGTIAFVVPGSGSFGGQTDLQNRTVNQATDASFSISGISGSVTRTSNSVSDIINGTTINLLKTGTTTITTGTDADGTGDLMGQIVDAYNDIVSFINENNTITRSETSSSVTNIYGSLAKTRIDDDFMQSFKDQLTDATASGSVVFGMSDLGLKTNRDGTITFDLDTFVSQVGADPTAAATVLTSFADNTAGVSGMIYQYTKFLGFIDVQQQSNTDQIENLNDSIEQQTRSNDQLRERLQLQFSRLESISGQLQSQQQALTNALAGLGR